jgi:hypothetical protein
MIPRCSAYDIPLSLRKPRMYEQVAPHDSFASRGPRKWACTTIPISSVVNIADIECVPAKISLPLWRYPKSRETSKWSQE